LANAGLKKFETLFKDHFVSLCGFAMKYVPDGDEAKGIVHEVFVGFWEKFESLPVNANYRSYLYTAVRNRCLNHIRDKKKHVKLDALREHEFTVEQSETETEELSKAIDAGIESLPEKCREVFEMSRIEGLKYAQKTRDFNKDSRSPNVKSINRASRSFKRVSDHIIFFLFQIRVNIP
jgi:RNA polymerase sigma-70 factor (ECF subfamily)